MVGSAGSEEKVSWLLEEAGVDAAFNYKKTADIIDEVGKNCPRGIDVYFENVGGVHLEAALEHMNKFGRMVMCGMIDEYNATKPAAGPANLGYVIQKQLTVLGSWMSGIFCNVAKASSRRSANTSPRATSCVWGSARGASAAAPLPRPPQPMRPTRRTSVPPG